ncbi:hypothetical protein DY534_16690 [Salmonella enterica]|nr:hypothetical protein [Salmonella enterica]
MIYLAFTLLWVTSLFRRQIPVVPDGNRVAIAPILITVETNERSQMLYGCWVPIRMIRVTYGC